MYRQQQQVHLLLECIKILLLRQYLMHQDTTAAAVYTAAAVAADAADTTGVVLFEYVCVCVCVCIHTPVYITLHYFTYDERSEQLDAAYAGVC